MTSWLHDVASGTETGDLACAYDWESTPLGHPDTWAPGLRAAVEICFSTRFAVLVTWGPELTMIYNDGYREMLGEKLHPQAMGAPAAELWGHIWADVGPLFDAVMSSGIPTWDEDFPLLMERNGYPEETRFTFSYGPLLDVDGTVCGVMDIASETTQQVVDRRRLECLNALSTTLHENASSSVEEITQAAVKVLSEAEDVGFTTIHVDGQLLAATRPADVQDTAEAAATRAQVLADGDPVRHGAAFIHPLRGPWSTDPIGTMSMTGNEHRPFDDAQRTFLALLARTTSTAIAGALARQSELDRARTVGDALQEAMIPAPPASPRWQTRYRPADHRLAVGGDWFDVVGRSDGSSALVVGDVVGHGLEAASRMGRLSSAASAALHDDTPPARTLDVLDRYAASVPGAEFSTVFCGIVNPESRTLVYSSAGHPPALLVRADGTTAWLDEAGGMPLTLGRGARREVSVSLGPGDTVVLYTDGLVERRGESLRDGLARLAAAGPSACAGSVVDVPDTLLDALLPDGAQDDVAIVAFRA